MNSRVWNRGKSDYSERFKNKIVTIPVGKFVTMNTYDAAAFRGSYPGKGIEKIIEVEDLPDNGRENENSIICHSCGESFQTVDQLNRHLAVHNPDRIKEDEADGALEYAETTTQPKKTQQVHKGWPKGVPRNKKNEAVNDSSADSTDNQGSGK